MTQLGQSLAECNKMINIILTLALTPIYVIVLLGLALVIAAAITVGIMWLTITAPATVHNALKQHQEDRKKLLGEQLVDKNFD